MAAIVGHQRRMAMDCWTVECDCWLLGLCRSLAVRGTAQGGWPEKEEIEHFYRQMNEKLVPDG